MSPPNIPLEILLMFADNLRDSDCETRDSQDETKDSQDETEDSQDETEDSQDETEDSQDETEDSQGEPRDSQGKQKDSQGELLYRDFNLFLPTRRTISHTTPLNPASNVPITSNAPMTRPANFGAYVPVSYPGIRSRNIASSLRPIGTDLTTASAADASRRSSTDETTSKTAKAEKGASSGEWRAHTSPSTTTAGSEAGDMSFAEFQEEMRIRKIAEEIEAFFDGCVPGDLVRRLIGNAQVVIVVPYVGSLSANCFSRSMSIAHSTSASIASFGKKPSAFFLELCRHSQR
jgi:hypothetical protein